MREETYPALIRCDGELTVGGPSHVARCRDVASLTVNQFDCCKLLGRSVTRYGTGKTSYWPLLRMLDLSQCGPCHPIHIEYRHCQQTKEAAYLNGRSNRVAYHSVLQTLNFFFLRAARH